MPKAAIGIKMSKDELAKFMYVYLGLEEMKIVFMKYMFKFDCGIVRSNCREEMERRTQEAEEFFQEQEEESTSAALIKSDDSDDDDWTDKSMAKPPKPSADEEMEMPEIIDTQMNEDQETDIPPAKSPAKSQEVSDLAPETIADFAETTDIIDNENQAGNQTPTTEQPLESDISQPAQAPNVIELHTERTELDDELDAMLAGDALPKPTKQFDFVPKLKGENGFVIDLEANDFEAKPKSQDGVDELFNRFIKNTRVKKNAASETQNIGYEQAHIYFTSHVRLFVSLHLISFVAFSKATPERLNVMYSM